MRRGHPLAVLLLLSLCFTNSDVGARQAGGTDPLFDAHGMQENRSYFSLLPFEQIDMLTGNVILTFTDLVLPGDAGLDVRIGRTYNSKGTAGWRFGLEGVPYSVQNPDGVTGGRAGSAGVLSEAPDGRRRHARPVPRGAVLVLGVSDQAVLALSRQRPSARAAGRHGLLLRIERSADGDPGRVPEPDRSVLPVQPRTGAGPADPRLGQVREVTFGSGGVAGKIPMTMTYLDRTWFYQTDNDGMLSTFRPPAGPDWLFGYDFFNTRVLRFVTTPNGGRVEYVFTLHNFAGAGGVVASRVLQTRRLTTDAFTLPGDWVFDYPPMVGMPAGVTGPDNTRTTFLHGTPPGASEPALLTLQRFQSIFFLEQETFTYEARAVTTWGGGIALRPASRTVTRDNRTFTTTWTYRSTNFGDYGRPHRIQETGEAQRTTEFTYTYNFDPAKWIKDKVESRTVTVNGESASISRTYRFDTGFMDSETRYTIPTQFTPDAHGNVANTTDAHGHITRYTYDWGVLKNTITPMHTVTRVINPDGTVASETQRGFTTSYQYDGLGRRTRVQPPAGLAFQTTYNANETIEFRTDASPNDADDVDARRLRPGDRDPELRRREDADELRRAGQEDLPEPAVRPGDAGGRHHLPLRRSLSPGGNRTGRRADYDLHLRDQRRPHDLRTERSRASHDGSTLRQVRRPVRGAARRRDRRGPERLELRVQRAGAADPRQRAGLAAAHVDLPSRNRPAAVRVASRERHDGFQVPGWPAAVQGHAARHVLVRLRRQRSPDDHRRARDPAFGDHVVRRVGQPDAAAEQLRDEHLPVRRRRSTGMAERHAHERPAPADDVRL